jgi:hypothetical protein
MQKTGEKTVAGVGYTLSSKSKGTINGQMRSTGGRIPETISTQNEKLAEKKMIREAFRTIEGSGSRLSESAIKFVTSLKKYYRRNKILSERQMKALSEILGSIQVEEPNNSK